MRRTLLIAGLAWLLPTPPLAAQEDGPPPTHLYEAYFQISYADLQWWIEGFNEHDLPVLQALRDEGVIEGWGVWQHSTGGGDYNWRFAIRTTNWANVDRFWAEYIGRLSVRAPEYFERAGGLIQAHRDEVWSIDEVHVPPDADPRYLYGSSFQLSFADLETWNAVWSEAVAPALTQAMDDGVLAGWVRLGHNTGGRYNWKVLYLFDDWDDMDNAFELVFAALTSDPEIWESVAGLITAHDDAIWEAIPDPDM